MTIPNSMDFEITDLGNIFFLCMKVRHPGLCMQKVTNNVAKVKVVREVRAWKQRVRNDVISKFHFCLCPAPINVIEKVLKAAKYCSSKT